MTDSNRLRMTMIRESTFGTTPGSPRMRTMRVTGESLSFQPNFIQSEEIRADRMNSDPIKVNETNDGAINFQLAFADDEGPLSELLRSALYNDWTNTPARDNDGTADSVITDVADTTDVVTCTSGAAFVTRHLVRFTGFGVTGNNGVWRCTTGSATVPAFLGANFTAEASVPADARMKVVGLEGASGDITALADGIGSTALDYTTMGLAVGQWIKIGGTGSDFRFATSALNNWARITAIAATKLTLDNLPTGWTTDSGTGKTIRVFFGDQIMNGTTRSSMTIERRFLGQTTPTSIIQRGMIAGQMELNYATEQIVTGSFTMLGLTGEQTTTSLDDTPDDASTAAIVASNVNVGRIAEGGAAVTDPNFIRSATVNINNNLRPITAVGTVGLVDIGSGECAVNGTIETYFGDNTLLAKLLAGTVGNINLRTEKNSQAMVVAIPRVTFTGGSSSAGGKNQDVMLNLSYQASIDSATSAHVIVDRLEYFEA